MNTTTRLRLVFGCDEFEVSKLLGGGGGTSDNEFICTPSRKGYKGFGQMILKPAKKIANSS